MTIIIDNIITPYCIHRYNEIARAIGSKLEVWYLRRTEKNRRWKHYPAANFRSKVLGGLPEVRASLNRRRPKIDQVIVCGWNSPAYLYAIFWCRRSGIRCTLWSGSTAYEKSWLRTVSRPAVKLAVKLASDYLAYGTRAKQYLISLGADPKKIRIFWNNVDLAHFQPSPAHRQSGRQLRLQLGIEPKAFAILFVGQLIERKGIDRLVESFQSIVRSNPRAHLLIAGVGPVQKKLAAENAPNIHWLGHVDYGALPGVYAAADLVVLPSREEVWGLVVNEALAAGKPVLASSRSGASELVPPRWRVTPAAEEITKKLRWFVKLSPPDRQAGLIKSRSTLRLKSHRRSAAAIFRSRTSSGE
jgi:glycosyltransferase involved in cell wall biosynthesis